MATTEPDNRPRVTGLYAHTQGGTTWASPIFMERQGYYAKLVERRLGIPLATSTLADIARASARYASMVFPDNYCWVTNGVRACVANLVNETDSWTSCEALLRNGSTLVTQHLFIPLLLEVVVGDELVAAFQADLAPGFDQITALAIEQRVAYALQEARAGVKRFGAQGRVVYDIEVPASA